jgi:CheY-like chemotaxis protein
MAMARVRLYHWNAKEARPLLEQLQVDGYTVDYPSDNVLERGFRALRESPPHAIVIDLTRLPSQGRHVAVAIRSRKTIRNIPIVFVDGDPEKVEQIRADLPDAIFTSRAKLRSALKRARPITNPAVAPYGNRTVAQKLGIREDTRVAVLDGPRGYARAVGELPAGARFEEDPAEVLPVTLWFVRDPEMYLASLPRMCKLASKSRLWIVYPKQQARQKPPGEVTLFFIRDEALAGGLLHYKTCALNTTWAGMLFAPRK